MFITDESSEIIVKAWIRAFDKRPKMTVFATVLFIGLLASAIYLLDKSRSEHGERERLQNADYAAQMKQLQDTERNLGQLMSFVSSQRSALQSTQDTLLTLQLEHKKLQPVIESDRRTIDAIFQAQESRAALNVKRERWIGFGLGILSSLLASFLWLVSSTLWRRRHALPKV